MAVDVHDLQRRVATLADQAKVFAFSRHAISPEDFRRFEAEYEQTGQLLAQLADELTAVGRHRDAQAIRAMIACRPKIGRYP